MTITTMEGLEAIPENGMVDVDGSSWARTATGLKRLDVDLPLRFFEGRVLAGHVTDRQRMPPAVGQWWAGTSRSYYITEVADPTVYYMSWTGTRAGTLEGSSRIATWSESNNMHQIGGPPQALADAGMVPLIEALAVKQADNRALRRQVNELQQNPPPHPQTREMRRDMQTARVYLDRIASALGA